MEVWKYGSENQSVTSTPPHLHTSTLLKIAAAVEQFSTHPLAEAILKAARERGQELTKPEEFRVVAGGGVLARIEGKAVLIGSARFLQEQGIAVDKAMTSPVLVAIDRVVAGGFEFTDEPLPEAQEALQKLSMQGLRIILCSGDRREAVEQIASKVGLSEFYAEMLPQDKATLVERLQREGRAVAFVGDGINDAPALAQADLGIAVGTGTQMAIENADIVLLNPDLRTLVHALRLSRQMNALIRQNLFFAFIYNVIGIPLAAMGKLDPMIAAAAMSLSSVSVVTNALRLLRIRL